METVNIFICIVFFANGFLQSESLQHELKASVDLPEDYRLVLQNHIQSARESKAVCTTAGKTCASCISVASCTGLGDGTYKADIQYCSADTYCQNGTCTNAPNPFCDGSANIVFPCTDTGVFPDPFYCNKYHFCTPPSTFIHVQATCEANFVYNAQTGACDTLQSKASICNNGTNNRFPVPLCNNTLQTGVVAGSIYYKCLTINKFLYPYLFKCPRGGTYNGPSGCIYPDSAVDNNAGGSDGSAAGPSILATISTPSDATSSATQVATPPITPTATFSTVLVPPTYSTLAH